MRSDFYVLPWAAQQAIRRGEQAARDAKRAQSARHHVSTINAELLAALKACVSRIERPHLSPDANVVLERAHAAIRKAEA